VSCHWGIICVYELLETLALNRRPNNNKIIITVPFVMMMMMMIIIIIKVRRGHGVYNTRRRELPRGPSLKE
jgi:hypothetical protein